MRKTGKKQEKQEKNMEDQTLNLLTTNL